MFFWHREIKGKYSTMSCLVWTSKFTIIIILQTILLETFEISQPDFTLTTKNMCSQVADDLGLKMKIGFFLHIPFPPWDIFRLFPWADEILQGMLGKYSCKDVNFSNRKYLQETYVLRYCLSSLLSPQPVGRELLFVSSLRRRNRLVKSP